MTNLSEFTFLSSDGKTQLHGMLWEPEGVAVRAVLQICHGVAEHIARYDGFARALNEQGIVVAGHDHLGHGKSLPEGGTPVYFGDRATWETVVDDIHLLHDRLREQYPDDTLYLLMGSDMFLSLHNWRRPEAIMAMAHIAPFSREAEDESAAFATQSARLEREFGAQVTVVPNPQVVELSSTEVRTALAQGGGEDLLPPPVWGYIRREHLYGTHTDLTHLTPEELRPIALSYLKPKRMPHVLGTEQEAVRLAERYGADVTKARIAALLHDCTKKLDMDEQLALCKKYHIPLDELERKALKLLHSKTGAAIARDVFAVDDDVYSAILYHTTGKPDMTLLEKIIYLADYIEPTRDFPGVEALRRTVYEDLDRGLLMGLTMTIDEMEEMGNPVHHMTRDARDYLMKRGIS